jgi:hypothetical protein
MELIKKAFSRIQTAVDSFQQILIEGNYHSDIKTLSKLFGFEKKVPILKDKIQPANLKIGNSLVNTLQTVGTRLIWLSLFAALAVDKILFLAIGAATIGAGLIALDYAKCRKSREEIITEVNFAGQTVTGKRGALCRLHQAQSKIINLIDHFALAAMDSRSETIKKIIAEVEQDIASVTVLDSGAYKASTVRYDFVKPQYRMAFARSAEKKTKPPNNNQTVASANAYDAQKAAIETARTTVAKPNA